MLKAIRFKDDHIIRRAGRERVEFRGGVNLLVGPNGSGKSTVVGSIASFVDGVTTWAELEYEGRFPVYSHDFALDARAEAPPGVKDELKYKMSMGRRSHGERSRDRKSVV